MEDHRLSRRLRDDCGLCRRTFTRLVRRYMLFDGRTEGWSLSTGDYYRIPPEANRREDASGKRKGGVVWHTRARKSLTMVMLARPS